MEFPFDHRLLPVNLVSSLLWLTAISVSIWFWFQRKTTWSENSLTIAMGGIAGGMLGAKLFYVLAEAPIWWNDQHFWLRMVAGKTVLGGLLGGWLGIKVGKKVVGEVRVLGDDFARIVPVGILIGRIGCLLHGCCPGARLEETLPIGWAESLGALGFERWPAPMIEVGFQLLFLVASWRAAKVEWLKGQHFHVYLMAYGLFRFVHEFIRATVRYSETLWSPYMWIAALCVVAGVVAFWRRERGRNVS